MKLIEENEEQIVSNYRINLTQTPMNPAAKSSSCCLVLDLP